MASKQITPADLEQRMAEARTQHAQAAAELQTAEGEAAQASLSAPLDEVTLARTDKALEKARERVRRWSEQISRLEVAGEELERDATAKRRQALLDQVDQHCRARERLATDLDAWVNRGMALFRQFGEANELVFRVLPHQPQDLPAMFVLHNLQNVLLARMAAASEGAFVTRGLAHSMDSVRNAPTVAQRAAEERTRLLAQYTPTSQPTSPEAA